jgi:hypothetical protein
MTDTNRDQGQADAEMGQGRLYRASRLWEFNVYGSLVAAAAGGVLMLTIGLIVLWLSARNFQAMLLLAVFVANLGIAWILLYPGNLVFRFPYAVKIEKGAGLRLFAPLKEIFIPSGNIREVRMSLLHHGYVIRLHRRQGVLASIVIHRFFGPQREALVQALRETLGNEAAPADTRT